MLALRYPLNTALTVSASLAQIGEFSFILAALGRSLGLLPELGQHLILAGAIISIAMNPLLFKAIAPLERWLRAKPALARRLARAPDPLAELPMSVAHEKLAGQVVLVGYGRVGRRIAHGLAERGIAFVVAERNRELVDQLRRRDQPAVAGNAAEPAVLVQAHIAHAAVLVIALAGRSPVGWAAALPTRSTDANAVAVAVQRALNAWAGNLPTLPEAPLVLGTPCPRVTPPSPMRLPCHTVDLP